MKTVLELNELFALITDCVERKRDVMWKCITWLKRNLWQAAEEMASNVKIKVLYLDFVLSFDSSKELCDFKVPQTFGGYYI